jgi:Kef-type K+ transport system membrane component KefB
LSSLVATLILIALALVGARVSFSTEKVSPGPRLLFRTGTHFLLVGFVLGPEALGLLTPEATRGLVPFLALGLGWVGFHFGLQLDAESLRLFPARFFLLAFGQAILTFVIFGIVAFGFAAAFGLDGDRVPMLVLAAACTAAITTPAGIAMISSTFDAKGKVRDLLFFVASLDALVGIVALQVTYSLYRPQSAVVASGGLLDLRWIGAAAGLGIICGIVFIWLTRYRPTSEELMLYLLGISAFAAGAALQWGLSPLFVSVTVGAMVANLGTSRRRVLPFMQRWEKIVYVTFLLLAGALLRIPSWIVFPAALGYALVRAGAKVVGSAAMVRVLRLEPEIPRTLGLGLIPQGGISIAMAASGVLMYAEAPIAGVDAGAAVFAVILLGVVLSELTGPFLTMSLLARVGELESDVPRGRAMRRIRERATMAAPGPKGDDTG